MQQEIDALLTHQRLTTTGRGNQIEQVDKKANYDAMQAEMQAFLVPKDGHGGDDLLSPNEMLGFGNDAGGSGLSAHRIEGSSMRAHGMPSSHSNISTRPYQAGMFIGESRQINPKLNCDPIMELKHIIGYSPEKCINLKWSKVPNENIVLFTSCGSLIAMDTETNQQKRFFFGHSSPICCFDVSQNGGLIASAQEGKTSKDHRRLIYSSIIRVWDYYTARCLQMLTMPVLTLQCVSFSPDGRFLACVGTESHEKRYEKEVIYPKQMIIVWDISRIHTGQKAEILAKHVAEFNIVQLKFSPEDNQKLVSCGFQNIRFWQIRDTRNIRGNCVKLNKLARDTEFTCLDFELSGTVEHVPNSKGSKVQVNGNRRVYVASKRGIVYQLNYDEEVLEATYCTNDSPIHSIAINEQFCVTGSEDQYLRIWTLDFNEFLMEAKHEGTVSSVDISQDGLRVACGTLNGSLGILNKSNQRYQTLLRSHTASIISMDFHLAKRNVITVSLDDTIRLWDLQTFDQVVEFSSPIDKPLCVSAHPSLPIFACGFQTGTMRIFDIEKTMVVDNFPLFDKPIRAIAYSPNGDLLVTCCENGNVALHNARRQHLPTKIINLDFFPEFVHVTFSAPIPTRRQNIGFNRHIQLQELKAMEGEGHTTESASNMDGDDEGHDQFAETMTMDEEIIMMDSLFGIMGEYGTSIMIYSSDSIILKHKIVVGIIIRSFQFTKNNREIIVVTKDQRVRVYSLATFEGAYLRELNTVHKGAVTCTDLSCNGGYMLTGGEDNLLKIWDYDAQKSVPYFFQAFIGHTYPLVDAIFNPLDNGMVISVAQNDGIYIWQFHGDTQTSFHPQTGEGAVGQFDTANENIHEPTMIERMRMSVKEKRKPKLAEYSFIVPEFKIQQSEDAKLSSLGVVAERVDNIGVMQYYQNQMLERNLCFNHFVSVKNIINVDVQLEKGTMFAADGKGKTIDPITVNGYDGFSGVHDNLLWSPGSGMMTYTLNNKLIIESTKSRSQIILTESEVRLSTIARSPNDKIIAVAEGETSRLNFAVIYLIDAYHSKLMNKITFFRQGVQSMAFSACNRYLIANSVSNEEPLVVFDVNSGMEAGNVVLGDESINKIIVNPYPVSDFEVDFVTVGQKGSLIIWKYDAENRVIHNIIPEMNQDLQNTDFTCAAFTHKLSDQQSEYLLIGTADGAVVAVNPNPTDMHNINKLEWLEHGKKEFILGEAISNIIYRHAQVVISGAQGTMVRYADKLQKILPPDDRDMITPIKTDSPIIATQMDDQNNEGIVGSSDGCIKYIQFNDNEHSVVQLVTKVSPYLDQIDILRYDINPNVFLSSVGKNSGDMKLLTSGMLDHIYTFPQYALGPVCFVASAPKERKNRMIGHVNGFIKIVQINQLKTTSIYKVNLDDGETLTCGVYSPSGHNYAVGTSFGNIYLGLLKRDPMSNQVRNNMFLAKVDRVSHGTDVAVTSIQLTSFNPEGCILAAFDNGQVRCWHSFVNPEIKTKLLEGQRQGRNSRKKQAYELSVLGDTQFDVIDKFDMFQNPHDVEELTEQELENLNELYGGKKYPDCEAVFNNAGSSYVDYYFCYVSALQYIFVRNYNTRETVKKIELMHFPTKVCIMEYNKIAIEAGLETLSKIGIASLVAVGTKEGKVLIYRLDSNEAKLMLKTKSGIIYGSVTALSIQDNGQNFIAGSQTGEVFSFQLMENLKGLEE